MALVIEFICKKCAQPCYEVVTPDRMCSKCRNAIATIKREAYIKECALMPLEARVKRVEEFLYDLDAERRLKALEAMNARY